MTDPTSGARPLAVVTGASTGIGAELARELGRRRYDLLLCADEPEVTETGARLEEGGTTAVVVQADLATPDGVEQLFRAVTQTGRPVDVLALNAGVGWGGAFVDGPLEAQLRVVDLDVRSLVHLAHLLVPAMVRRGSGRVLVTSSVAATMPGPWYAVYAASKAFAQSFALALRAELADTGVTVTSLQPGPTDTEFFRRAGMEDTPAGQGPKDDPADVARRGVDALLAGDDHVVVGLMGKGQVAMSRVLPESARAAVHGAMAKPQGDDATSTGEA